MFWLIQFFFVITRSLGEKDPTAHHSAMRHHREGASSTISSTEAPSPRKDGYPSHQAPSGESNTPHGRSASIDTTFSMNSTSTYASTQSSKSVRLLPPLPGESSSQPQRVDTLDDLVAAVGDAIADIGLVSVKDVPPPNVLPPSWESKALPPIIPGTPSPEALNETDLQRANTWSTGQSSAVTDSSVTTSSSAVTRSSIVTSSSAAQSSVTSPGSIRGHEDNHHSKDDTTVDSRMSERVYDRDRLREASQPTATQLKHQPSTNESSYTTSSPPRSVSDHGESKRSVSGASHKRQATISGISVSSGNKRQSVLKRRPSAHSAFDVAITPDFNPFEKAPAFQNQSYTRSPEKQRTVQTQTQVVQVQRPAKSTSPLPPPPPERSKRLKQKAVGWPQAMSFGDVLKMRTALDRAAGYAEKINELAATDSGLQAWIFEVKMQKRGMFRIFPLYEFFFIVLSSR